MARRKDADRAGDWYDVAAVVAAANQAQADAGEKRRFVLLESGDQIAALIVVDPAALATAARELYLPLSADPDAARRAGNAFDEQVTRELKEGTLTGTRRDKCATFRRRRNLNTNPAINVVVFQVKHGVSTQVYSEAVPTQVEGGIRRAWMAVRAKSRVQPSQVSAIFSEWEPSSHDLAFMNATFHSPGVQYCFRRPTDGRWEQAFAQFHAEIQQALATQVMDEAGRMERSDQTLYPVLRTYSAEDAFGQMIVYRPVGADLAVFLAHAGATSRGTTGINYLMRNRIDASEPALDRLFAAACENLRTGMKVTAAETDGERFFTMEHPSGLAAGALAFPDFYANVAPWLSTGEVFAAFPCPDCLYIALPGGAVAAKLRQLVVQSNYCGAVALTPACYHVGPFGLYRVAVRPAPAT